MVTIAHLVEKEVREQPFLQEAVRKKLINYAALAEQIMPKIEQEMRKKVKYGAVIMALRRLADKLEKRFVKLVLTEELKKSEITMKSDIMVITALKSSLIFAVLKRLYDIVDFERGDFLTVTQGLHEVTVLVSQKYKEAFLKELENEKIIGKEENAVSLSLKYSDAFIHTPGLVFAITRELAWRDVNIIEFASTMTEIILIINKKDSIIAYKTLQELI